MEGRVKVMNEDGNVDAGGKGAGQVNVAEGRVPVSWDECADWLEWFGPESVVKAVDGYPTRITAETLRRIGGAGGELSTYRLLPPPGLVAAPESMDGGGWLGEGRHIPEGWPWRRRVGIDWRSSTPMFSGSIVQCRPPVPERDVVEVPLTRLVGRTIEKCEGAGKAIGHGTTPEGVIEWWPEIGPSLPFPDGSLDLDTGLVRVYAEGDEK